MKKIPSFRNRRDSLESPIKRSISLPRFSLKNFSIALLVNAGLVHMSLYGSVPLTTFESPIAPSTNLSSVSSEWTVANGQAKVEPGVGYQGTQGVKISQGLDQEARITRAIAWNSSEQTAFIDFRIKPAANQQGSSAAIAVNGTQIGIQKNSEDATKGDIWVLNGTDPKWISGPSNLDAGLQQPQWLLTYGMFSLNTAQTAATDYMRITLRQDYERKVWDLYVDGKLTAAELRFEKQSVLNALHIYGSTDADVLLDDLQAIPTNMLFADADKDGIPDSVELANGSNPYVKDRDAIDPATGKTYLQKYLDQLWPNNTPSGTGAYVAPSGSIPPLTLPEHTPVGALKGNFSVGGDGSATYSIPIDLPKGTSGMEPQLSLGYSSNGGNSICGLGFGLSGLQSITRGPASLKKDGFIDGVDFDEKDRFFLNGERLVCIAGVYGADGSEYRTEIDSYSRIKLTGNANSGQASFWTVQTKAGLTIQFGNTKGSKVTCSNAPAPMAWAVNRVTDAVGNYYKVLYAEGTSDAAIPDDSSINYTNSSINSHRVAKISYTGNDSASLSPYIDVNFTYEDRTDTSFAYTFGVKSESNKRLKSIAVMTDDYLNHSYAFNYANSSQTNRSLLQTIAKNVNGAAVPLTTTFDWDAHLGSLSEFSMWSNAGTAPVMQVYGSGQNNDGGIVSHASIDNNGNTIHLTGSAWRHYPLPQAYNVTPATLLTFDYKVSATTSDAAIIGLDSNLSPDSTHLFQVAGTQAANVNRTWHNKSWIPLNPAIAPFAQTSPPTNPPTVYQSTTFPSTTAIAAPPDHWVRVTIPIGTRFTGLRGNLVFINDDDNGLNGIGECWFRDVKIYEPSNPSVPPIIFPVNNWEVPQYMNSDWVDRGMNFIDVNVDGLIDMVRNDVVAGTDWNNLYSYKETYLNTGAGWTTDSDAFLSPSILSTHDLDDTDSALNYMGALANFSDYNADGKPDLMNRVITNETSPGEGTVSFEALLHNGAGWDSPNADYKYPFKTQRQASYSIGSNPRFRDWLETDLNGDGFVDLIVNTRRGTLSFGPNDPNNTPLFSYRVLTHKGSSSTGNCWQVNNSYLLPDPGDSGTGFYDTPYVKDGPTQDDIGRGFADLNGDGLPEFYSAHPTLKKTFINKGNGWDLNTFISFGSNGSYIYNNHGNYASRIPEAMVNTNGKSTGCRLVDLNGDGLADLLRAQGDVLHYSIANQPIGSRAVYFNTGDTRDVTGVVNGVVSLVPSTMFQAVTPATLGSQWILPYALDNTADGNDNWGNELTDINGDGLVDVIYSNYLKNETYLNTGTTIASHSAYNFPSDIRFCASWSQVDNKRRAAILVDVNGDGFLDIISKINTSSPEIWLNKSKTEKINKITDNFGSDIQIEYTRLNDPTIKSGFNSRVYQKNFGTLPAGHIGVIDSRLVVSRYSAPTYLNGTNNRRYTSHRYGDLRYDRNHETSLGFGWAEIKDELTQQITRTEYRQDFPFAGSPSVTHTKVLITQENIDTAASHGSSIFEGATAGWKCLTKETADYAQKQPELGIGGGGYIYRPVQIEAIKEQYDLKRSSTATSIEPCGDFKSRTRTTQALADYDDYGFLRNSIVESLDGTIIATSSVYDHNIDDTKWHLGRLKASAVVKSKIGHMAITKSSNFTYDAFGMLKTETIEPGNALSVTKSYTYDDFGNITHSDVIGKNSQGNLETRSSQSIYDARGRFVIEEKNQLNHRVLYHYDLNRALLKNTTDINGLVTHFRYDGFGTLTLTLHPDGTRTGEVTGQVLSNNSVVPANLNVPNIIKYYRAKQTSGGPVAYAYFDAAGREILSRSTTLVNATAAGEARYATIYSHNQYDAFGRTTHTSLPFAANETPMYTVRLIDVLGRTYKTIHPNGSFDKVDCYGVAILNGQSTTYSCVTASNGQTLERWEDQHGQMIQSRDESGLITAFIHDLEGRLTSVKMENTPRTTRASSDVLAADHTLLLRNKFDIFGNKSEVWEINSGTSSSTYSALGEVATSTNAMGQTTSYEYDVLGRPTKIIRPDGEGTFINEYDTAGGTAAKGKPSKITGPSGYLEDIIYDSLGRPTSTSKTQFGETFNTYTSYDALGRVKTSTDAGGLTTCTHYDERYSIPVKIVLASPPPSGMTALPGVGTTLWEAGTYDARGNALTQKLGNGVNITQAYQTSTGNLLGLSATRAGSLVQNKAYAWDSAGNLTSRTNNHVRNANGSAPSITSLHESFGYDIQNRLTSRTIGSNVENYSYDVKGNLLTKPGAALTYNKPGPHQVGTATIKGAARTYQYNTAGYVTSDSKRNYYWSSFGQLKDLTYSAAPALHDLTGTQLEPAAYVQSQFFFDAAGNRARQWKTRTSTGSYKTESTLYLGSYEREIHSSSANPSISPTEYKRVHRHSLGDMVYTRTITPSTGETVRLTTKLDDHLGSTDVLITSKWQNNTFTHESTEYQAFDPWGERAATTTAVAFRQTDSDPFRRSAQDYDRGYTGHEMLDDSGIIHMNGRLYDAELGRMLSADPFVQVPEYSQNFNRYSYVLNNPLNKTDPTGYSWLSKAFHKIGTWVKENWRTIAMIALGALAFWGAGLLVANIGLKGLIATIAQGAIAGAAMGGVSAAISGGNILKGMAMGAINGGITGGLGGMGNGLLKAIGTATISGFSNVAMGGKFQDGFIDSLKFQAAIGFAKGLSSFMKSHLSGKHYDGYANISRGEEAMPLNDAGYKIQDNYNLGARTPAQLMKGVDLPEGWSFDRYSHQTEGTNLNYIVFENSTKKITLMSMVGTQIDNGFWKGDWGDDIRQGIGVKVPQYMTAMKHAQMLNSATLSRGYSFVLTGHSLGGGLAAAASAVTGAPALIFNAAGVNPATFRHYGSPLVTAPGANVVHYMVNGEILNGLQLGSGIMPQATANTNYGFVPRGPWNVKNVLLYPAQAHRPPMSMEGFAQQ